MPLPKFLFLCFLCAATCALSACSTVPRETLAPARVHGAAPFAADDLVITVQRGQTLSQIAQRYNVSVEDIAFSNGIAAPYRLYPRQRLRIPRPAFHTVRQGESLSQIGQFYRVSPQTLVRLNRLQPPYRIFANQQIALRSQQAAAPVVPLRPGPSRIIKVPYPAPKPVMAPPAAATPMTIAQPPAATTWQPVSPPAPITTMPVSAADQTALNSLLSDARARFATGSDDRQETRRTGSYPIKAGTKAPRFRRPVNGRIVSSFGKTADGGRNDGINIAAARGRAVRTAASGEVVYADNEIEGYGNLVLLRHGDGWMTAYAHLDKLLVSRGEWVENGQTIGTVGSTGSVSSPQLHFEIRKDAKALDPEDYL